MFKCRSVRLPTCIGVIFVVSIDAFNYGTTDALVGWKVWRRWDRVFFAFLKLYSTPAVFRNDELRQ
jgi:hypothetical protein